MTVLLIPFVFGSCIGKEYNKKMKDWSIEFILKKKLTVDSYYVNSKGEGIRMIRDVDCNVQLEKYNYQEDEIVKIYNSILLLQNKKIEWDCLNDSSKDGINAEVLLREENVEKKIELPYCVIEQRSDEFMEMLLMFESIAKDKKKEIILENYIVPPPPMPN